MTRRRAEAQAAKGAGRTKRRMAAQSWVNRTGGRLAPSLARALARRLKVVEALRAAAPWQPLPCGGAGASRGFVVERERFGHGQATVLVRVGCVEVGHPGFNGLAERHPAIAILVGTLHRAQE